MSDNIILDGATCNVCEHCETCKYKVANVRGEIQLKMELVAQLITDPFIVRVSCRYFK